MRKPLELSEEAKELRRRYYREWNAKNRDRLRLYIKRYWEKKAQEEKEKNSQEKEGE